MGPFGVAQIVVFIGFLELFVMKQKEGSFPGDMSRINPFEKQWESFDEETKLKKRAIELNNGRAAQMGIFAMVIHEIINNQPYIINNILGESILRSVLAWFATLAEFRKAPWFGYARGLHSLIQVRNQLPVTVYRLPAF